MPCSFKVFSAANLIIVRLWGSIRLDEILEMNAQYSTNTTANSGFLEFVDLSEVTEIDLDFMQVRAIITNREKTVPKDISPRVAAIYAPGDVSFGMARMFQSFSAGRLPTDIHVFDNVPDALAHLDRDEQTLADLHKSLSAD